MRKVGHSWLGGTLLAVVGCGGPQIRATPDYHEHELAGAKVLFVPLSVTNELGDDRTGIILSDETRRLSGTGACRRTAEDWHDGRVVCFDQGPLAKSAELGELEKRFATDQPIPADLWRRLRELSGADHALMFRPESVSSSHDVSQDKSSHPDLGMVLLTGVIVASLVGSHETKKTSASTEIEYTLSASLVDMRTGKLLKVGVDSGSGSRREKRSLGYAEAPPAVPILESIMLELGDQVLKN